ncbi:hypothetical protein [Streptomyces sp. NPDC013171]|uniref:hypothetical protein n=1 Tax=Streptomyces sp. NPDC013171 TaxID=3364863 RepID=UPI0036BEE380
MNIITKRSRFDDPTDVLSGVRERPLTLREVLELYGFPSHRSEATPSGFVSADDSWLDRGELFLLPTYGDTSALIDVRHEDPQPRSRIWLEGHFIDDDRKEVVTFPNDADIDSERIMLFARHGEMEPIPGEGNLSGLSPMKVVSMEIHQGQAWGPYLLVPDGDCFFNVDGVCTCPPGIDVDCREILWAGKVLVRECLRYVPEDS